MGLLQEQSGTVISPVKSWRYCGLLDGFQGVRASKKSRSPGCTDLMENKLPTKEATPLPGLLEDITCKGGCWRSRNSSLTWLSIFPQKMIFKIQILEVHELSGGIRFSSRRTWCSVSTSPTRGQRTASSARPPGGSETCWMKRGKCRCRL